ncbi:LamG-like jellyroll fold domain-containing protein [Streptosporangium algeriense]|uniref:LamG-like jellyroll fold domain-containing protein n=1 Tax=Streptosporangium algeriense TaxID=1682748 RepID=A0ABW3DI40_9ACTN
MPATALDPTPSLPSAPAARSAAASDPVLKTAWNKATASGKPVEVPSRFTETMKVWADPDGKNLRAELHTRPVQLKNKAGVWESVDTRIVSRDGALRAMRVKTPLTFGARGTRHLVSAAGQRGVSGLDVTRALPEPKISGSTVTYPDAVAPGADLVVQAQADGFVSQVVFRRRPEGPVTVRLPLTLPKGTAFGTTPQGQPQLKDADGRAAASPIVLTAMDAKVETSPDQGKSSRVDARVRTSGTTSELVFTPDPAFLADPAVTYPVTIAAASEWFGGGVPDDAWVNKNDPYSNHAADGWLRAGTTQTSADIARVYLKYNTDAPELEGARVVQADLIVWNYKSGGPNGALCGDPLGAGIVAERVTSAWDTWTLDWSHQPSRTGSEGLNRAGYNYDATGTWCAKDEQLWHRITNMARAWIEQDVPNHGLVLRAATESAAVNWRQYYAGEYSGDPYPGYRHPPTLMVEYEPATVEEVDIAYERDGLPDDRLPSYEELLANQIPNTSTAPVVTPITAEEAAQRQQASDQTTEVEPDTLPSEPPDADPSPEPDSTPPAVVATVPSDDATGVPATTSIAAFFGEPVTAAQMTVKDADGNVVPGNTTLSPAKVILDFRSLQALSPGITYTAEVSGATDTAGNSMATPYTWSFTTATGTESPTPTPTPTSTSTPQPGLVAAYGMNEGSGTTVGDSSGRNNTGAATDTTWTTGRYGKALSFNGSSSWVTVQDAASLRLTTGMTLSAWVNPASVADWSSVVSKELSAEGVSYTVYASNGGSVPSGWVQTSPENFSTIDGISPLPVNTWNHLALTYDGAVLRLFVNGQQVAETALSGGLHNDSGPLRIGGNAIWGEFFGGLIDEVRLYNRAQTATEIQTDMNTPVGSGGPNPSPTPTVTPTPTSTPVPGLVAAYGMEEGSGTTVGDSSGRNNTGAATDTTWATGKHGTALSFNGSSSWITVPHAASLRLTTGMTLSAWVKPTDLTNWRTVVMKDLIAEDGASYGLYASDGNVPAGWLLTTEGEQRSPKGTTALPANTWSHLALTYDGTTARLYVNGAQAGQLAVAGDFYDDGGDLHIGGNSVWGEFFGGLIDEVRLYNRAQTATEIQTDMNTSVGSVVPSALAKSGSGSTAGGTAPRIAKFAVSARSGQKPELTVWAAGPQGDERTVELEIARRPSKSVKGLQRVWAGKVAGRLAGSRLALRVPNDRFRGGQRLRWRARVAVDGANGAWTTWRPLTIAFPKSVAGSRNPLQDKPLKAETAMAAPTPGPWPTWPNKRITFDKCWESNLANSKKRYPHGWVRDSYNWCSVRTVGRSRTEKKRFWCGPCVGWKTEYKVKGKLEFLFSVAGHTFTGGKKDTPTAEIDQNNGGINSRTIKMWARVDRIKVTGEQGPVTFPESTDLTVNIGGGAPSGMNCAASGGGSRKSTIAEWRTNPQQYFEFVSDKNASAGPNRLSVCTFTPILVLGWQAGLANPFINTKMADMAVRCDTSEDLKSRYGGCVYTEFTPTFKVPMIYEWENGEPVMNESANLIRMALEEPGETYPKKTDEPKVIPGEKKVGPLHRSSSKDRDNKNRTESKKYCAQMLAELKVPKPIDRDCDEFPFAATHEGSAGSTTNRNVAVDYIIWDHNQRVGSFLGWFFQDYRVLGSDALTGQDRWHPYESFFVKTPNV